MRERWAIGILVILLIFLVAFVFAILGKGSYNPSSASVSPAASSGPHIAFAAPASI